MIKYLFIILLVGVWSCEDNSQEPKGYKELKWFSYSGGLRYDSWTNQYNLITKYNKVESVSMSMDTHHEIENECEWVRYYLDSVPSFVEFHILDGTIKKWRVDSLSSFSFSEM